MVNESFEEFLDRERPRTDTLVQAARFYLALRTDDRDTDDMLTELRESARGDGLAEALDDLARNPEMLNYGAAAVLSNAWAEPGGPEQVRNAFYATRGKLPVVEASVLAVSVMYGVYLLISRSIKRSTKITVRRPDGTVIEYDDKEYFGPAGPLSSLLSVLPPAAPAPPTTEFPQTEPPPGA